MNEYKPKYLVLQDKICKLIENNGYSTHECYVALMENLTDVMITHAESSFSTSKEKREELCKYANHAIQDLAKVSLLHNFDSHETPSIEFPPCSIVQ